MTKKHYYTWQDVEDMVSNLITKMYQDEWKPDYILGVTRGGLIPATMLSNKTDIPMYTLDVRLRDIENLENRDEDPISDRIIYDMHGYNGIADWGTPDHSFHAKKNILIVDDINDSGATFKHIIKECEDVFFFDSNEWSDAWDNNVRFAVMTENLSSEFEHVRYGWHEINKAESPMWMVYPWEKQD